MNSTYLIVFAATLAFAVAGLLGFKLIPWLRKLKYGQTILDIGPVWHKNKQGTPTMGGIMFIIGVVAALIGVVALDFFTSKSIVSETGVQKVRLWGGLLMALGFGLIGFIDDYIKVVKKRNLGLTAMQKTLFQLIVSVGYLITLYLSYGSRMYIPFVGDVNLGVFYWILGLFIIYGTVNAVNLTDGIDGLCSSVTFIVAVAFMIGAGIFQQQGMSVLAAALAGGCAGFLVWNWNPAKVFMGDTGSMFLGGMVVALAFGLNVPLILIPMGIIYIIETGSVVIQVFYFKLTKGKRLFKMTPIHHHFEMSKWSETKIVTVFSLITFIGCAAGVAILYYG